MTDRIHAHSFGTSTGDVPAHQVYTSLLAGLLGTTFVNTSHGGDMVADQARHAFTLTYGAGDRTIVDIGLNDHGWNGIDSAKLGVFEDQYRNLIGRCALHTRRRAQSFGVESGPWTDCGVSGSFGRGTTTPGATRSDTCTGTVAYRAIVLVDHGYGGTYELLKNGAVIGSYSSSQPVQTYVGSQPATIWPYGLRLHRITGCVPGDVITVRHVTGYVYDEWAADNNQTIKPKVFATNIVKSNLYDRTGPAGFKVTSEANGAAYSAAQAQVIADFIADGLDVKLVDVRAAINPALHLHADGIHLNVLGNEVYANTIAAAMAIAPAPPAPSPPPPSPSPPPSTGVVTYVEAPRQYCKFVDGAFVGFVKFVDGLYVPII